MKVLIVNGSPHQNGTTMASINEMISVFNEAGIDTEVFQLGNKPLADCVGCGYCRKNEGCVIKDDSVNEFVGKAKDADGFVFATPVYYAHPTGRIMSFLDRVFYSGSKNFQFKVGAAIAVSRRGGEVASYDVLNKYFGISQMPIASSTYWNVSHGAVAKDAPGDEEGLQTMRNLARNMIWMMRCIEAGKNAGVELPASERTYKTNFVH